MFCLPINMVYFMIIHPHDQSSCLSRILTVQTIILQEVKEVGGEESAEAQNPPLQGDAYPPGCRVQKITDCCLQEARLTAPQTLPTLPQRQSLLNHLTLPNSRRGAPAEEHSGTCLEHSTSTHIQLDCFSII